MDKSDTIFLQKLCAGESAAELSRWEGILEKVLKSEKAELHCHLAGSMRPETLQHLARSTPGIEWDRFDKNFDFTIVRRITDGSLEDVTRCLEYRERGGSLTDYMRVYSLPKAVITTEDSLRRVALEVSEDNYREGVRYLEIRFNPWMLTGLVKIKAYIRSLASGLGEAAEKYPDLEVVLLLSLIKDYDSTIADRIIDESLEVNNEPGVRGLIKGVDSAGEEINFEPTKHAAAFECARKAGLGVVCHAGESYAYLEDGIKMIEDALDVLGAKRIGHGLAAGVDPSKLLGKSDLRGDIYDKKRIKRIAERQGNLRERLKKEDILIEACPSSNLQTGNVPSPEEHPLKEFLADGVPVAICTDNRWISHAKLSWEIVRMAKLLNLDMAAIQRLIETPFRYKLENLKE